MAGANKEPFGSRPGPKSVHTHGPYTDKGGSAAGGGSKKAGTPSKTKAHKNPLH